MLHFWPIFGQKKHIFRHFKHNLFNIRTMEVWWIHKNNIFPCRDSTTPPATPPYRFPPRSILCHFSSRVNHTRHRVRQLLEKFYRSSTGHWTLCPEQPQQSSIHPRDESARQSCPSRSFAVYRPSWEASCRSSRQTDRQGHRTGTQRDTDTARGSRRVFTKSPSPGSDRTCER